MSEFNSESVTEKDYIKILELWRSRAHKAAAAQYMYANECFEKDRKITLLNAIFSISVLFFANSYWIFGPAIQSKSDFSIPNLLVSLASFLLVLITILQYLFRYGKRGWEHKISGKKYSNLMRKIERYLCKSEYKMGALHSISRRYSEITNSSPLVPEKVWSSDKHKNLKLLSDNILEMEKQQFELDLD